MKRDAGAAAVASSLSLPAVIGHRGAAAAAPENTLAGLRKARELGVAWVEFDVHLGGEGVPILLHDDTVDRTTDGRGIASSMPLSALRRLDAGAWFGGEFAGERIPSFEETIETLGELGLGANVEIKPARGQEAATARAALELLLRRWPASLPTPLISSFSELSLAAAREVAPDLPRGYLCGAVPGDWRRRLDALGCTTIHCDHHRLRAAQVAEVRAAGYPLLVYTVNAPDRAALLRGWGVDSIITDCPDRIIAELGR